MAARAAGGGDAVSAEAFFADTPAFGAEIAAQVAGFVSRFSNTTTPIVVVTSGGTKVPLERQCVRFIDNFSAGTRGALSAERFLEVRALFSFNYNVLSTLCSDVRTLPSLALNHVTRPPAPGTVHSP